MWQVYQLQLVQRLTRDLKFLSGVQRALVFEHHTAGYSSQLLIEVCRALHQEFVAIDGAVVHRVLQLLFCTWAENLWTWLWKCFSDSTGPICTCALYPFPVLASPLQKSIPPSSCFLLSCWHLFLALPLLYLYPLIVITACQEARIGEINKMLKKTKNKNQPKHNNPECSLGQFRQGFGANICGTRRAEWWRKGLGAHC